MKKLIFESEQASLWLEAEHKLISHRFNKYIHGQALKEVLLAGCEAMEEFKCTKWLSDDRNNVVLSIDDRNWAFTYWEPRVIKAGWKHWALLPPNEVFGKINMKLVGKHYTELGINLKLFNEYDTAYKWILNQ